MYPYKLIGITGLMGAGKDSFADGLTEGLKQRDLIVYRTAFARAMKNDLLTFIGKRVDKSVEGYRKLCQGYGQVMRAVYGNTFWVKRLHEEVAAMAKKDSYVLIPDVRYPEEATFIRGLGGIVVCVWADDAQRIERMEARGDVNVVLDPKEQSEQLNFPKDYYMENRSSLDDLISRTKKWSEHV